MSERRRSTSGVSALLEAARAGRNGAVEDLFTAVYGELRRMAGAQMNRERPGSLATAELVHEAYLRLVGEEAAAWGSRAHFFAAAGEAMRRILVERARSRSALKRGGDRRRVEFAEEAAAVEPPSAEVLALDEALGRLEARDRGMALVVKLRYFAGLTIEEIASVLDLSERTVYRRWTAARAWLNAEIAG